jgi:hypothetical protein
MGSWKMSAMLLAAVLVTPLTAAADHDYCSSDVDIHFSYSNHPVYYDPWVVEFVDYYGCAPVVVERYRTTGFPGEDLAVAVYLSHRSGTSLGLIVDWRRHGLSWYDVTRRCNLSSAVFITPVRSHYDVCGVYARPYARWRSHRDNWRFV